MIPTACINEFARIQVGYQARERIQPNLDGSHVLLQAKDINNSGEIDWDSLIRFFPKSSMSKAQLQNGDVIFLAKGYENTSISVTHLAENVLASNSFYILRINQAFIIPDYLSWWINQAPAQEYIKLNRGGSYLPFLSVTALSQLEVPIPSLEKQRTIAKIETLRKKEIFLLDSYLSKKNAWINKICVNSLGKEEMISDG